MQLHSFWGSDMFRANSPSLTLQMILAGVKIMSLNVWRVTILPLALIFLAGLLILKINFSQRLQNRLYGGMVTAKISESLQNVLTMSSFVDLSIIHNQN